MKHRRCLVVAKQRMGRTLCFVGKKESDALEFLKERIEPGTIIQVDGSNAWHGLMDLFECLRTEHLYTFGTNQQHTNNAESFFSGFRKMHRGVHHHMSGNNMGAYAAELAWKRDYRELTVSDKFELFMRLCMSAEKKTKWPRARSEIAELQVAA